MFLSLVYTTCFKQNWYAQISNEMAIMGYSNYVKYKQLIYFSLFWKGLIDREKEHLDAIFAKTVQ